MTLYRRIDHEPDEEWVVPEGAYYWRFYEAPVGTLFMPVEPCEHGNIDPHEVIDDSDPRLRDVWECPGAGVGEETP